MTKTSAGACIVRLDDPTWETATHFRIPNRDLTVKDGEVTPSIKVRAKAVEDTHRPPARLQVRPRAVGACPAGNRGIEAGDQPYRRSTWSTQSVGRLNPVHRR